MVRYAQYLSPTAFMASSFMPVSSKVSDCGGSGKEENKRQRNNNNNSDDVEKQKIDTTGEEGKHYDPLKTGDSSSDGGEGGAAGGEEKEQRHLSSGSAAVADFGFGTSEEPDVDRDGMWFRGVSFVMRHPWPFAIVIIGCLAGLMSVFVTEARFAQQSYGNFPLDSPTRHLAETVNDDFPKSNGHSSVEIFVETIATNGE